MQELRDSGRVSELPNARQRTIKGHGPFNASKPDQQVTWHDPLNEATVSKRNPVGVTQRSEERRVGKECA